MLIPLQSVANNQPTVETGEKDAEVPATLYMDLTPPIESNEDTTLPSSVAILAKGNNIGESDTDSEIQKNNSVDFSKPKNRMLCQCGSSNCRKFLF